MPPIPSSVTRAPAFLRAAVLAGFALFQGCAGPAMPTAESLIIERGVQLIDSAQHVDRQSYERVLRDTMAYPIRAGLSQVPAAWSAAGRTAAMAFIQLALAIAVAGLAARWGASWRACGAAAAAVLGAPAAYYVSPGAAEMTGALAALHALLAPLFLTLPSALGRLAGLGAAAIAMNLGGSGLLAAPLLWLAPETPDDGPKARTMRRVMQVLGSAVALGTIYRAVNAIPEMVPTPPSWAGARLALGFDAWGGGGWAIALLGAAVFAAAYAAGAPRRAVAHAAVLAGLGAVPLVGLLRADPILEMTSPDLVAAGIGLAVALVSAAPGGAPWRTWAPWAAGAAIMAAGAGVTATRANGNEWLAQSLAKLETAKTSREAPGTLLYDSGDPASRDAALRLAGAMPPGTWRIAPEMVLLYTRLPSPWRDGTGILPFHADGPVFSTDAKARETIVQDPIIRARLVEAVREIKKHLPVTTYTVRFSQGRLATHLAASGPHPLPIPSEDPAPWEFRLRDTFRRF